VRWPTLYISSKELLTDKLINSYKIVTYNGHDMDELTFKFLFLKVMLLLLLLFFTLGIYVPEGV